MKEDFTMALSLDSKIKDIMRSPEGKAVMEKWAPGSSKDPRMKLVGALMSSEKLKAKMGNKMNEGMLMPYEKLLASLDKK